MTKKDKELLEIASFRVICGILFFLLVVLVLSITASPNIKLCLLGIERWFIECDVADYGWNPVRTEHYERVLSELNSIVSSSFYGNIMVNGNFILQIISLVVQTFVLLFSTCAGICFLRNAFMLTKQVLLKKKTRL